MIWLPVITIALAALGVAGEIEQAIREHRNRKKES